MKVYTAENGRVTAEAESVEDVKKILALEPPKWNTTKARAVLAQMRVEGKLKPLRISGRTRHYTKTHSCGMKYKYLKKHLRYCPEVIGTPVEITQI